MDNNRTSNLYSPERVQIQEIKLLADEWHVLRQYIIAYQFQNGSWERTIRETCHRGDSVVILLYSPSRQTVIITNQFRLPVFINGHREDFLEFPGGLIENLTPIVTAQREIEEEVGMRIEFLTEVFKAYMSPASLTEIVHFFIAEFSILNRVSIGGGVPMEGEYIEVREIPFKDAFDMVEEGKIVDGRTILLLYYAKINNLLRSSINIIN